MANMSEILNRDHRTTSYHKSSKLDENELDNLDNCDKCQNKSQKDKKSNKFAKSFTNLIRRSKLK